MKKRYLVLIILSILLASLVGCSSSRDSITESSKEVGDVSVEADYDGGLSNSSLEYSGINTNRKIIQSSYLVMETLDFDTLVTKIKESTYSLDGYFENMRVDGKRKDLDDDSQERSASFSIRIPKDKYEAFMGSFGDEANIIVNELNSEDLTEKYIDTEARLKALKTQEGRLLEIMEEASKIEDIIALEERLSQVRYEIERFTGDIRKWDNLVDYTRIQLEIREVGKISEPKSSSVITRSIDQLFASVRSVIDILELLLVVLFGLIPYLVIIVPIILLIKLITNRTNIFKIKEGKKREELSKEISKDKNN